MRYSELIECRPWKHYSGRDHVAYLAPLSDDGPAGHLSVLKARYGLIHTGRSRVFYGFFIKVRCPKRGTWVGESRRSMRGALRDVERQLKDSGYQISAVGLTCAFYETGLSGDSGFGYLKGSKGPVHMLEPTSMIHANSVPHELGD